MLIEQTTFPQGKGWNLTKIKAVDNCEYSFSAQWQNYRAKCCGMEIVFDSENPVRFHDFDGKFPFPSIGWHSKQCSGCRARHSPIVSLYDSNMNLLTAQ